MREIYSRRELSVVRGLYQRETFMKDLYVSTNGTHLLLLLLLLLPLLSLLRGTRDDGRSPTRDTSHDLSNNLSNPLGTPRPVFSMRAVSITIELFTTPRATL